MRFIHKALLFFFSSCILSCNNDDKIVTNTDQGFDYYPLEIGYEWIYDVELIELQVSADDTTLYQVKEVIDSTYTIGNEAGYIVHRLSRTNPSEVWVADSVWAIQKNNKGIVKQENGYPFQKVEFPTEVSRNWDGNKWNAYPETAYRITVLDSSLSLENQQYNQVMKIDEGTSVNLIEEKENYTLYAKGIGPIMIVKKNLERQPGEKQLGEIRTYSLSAFNF